MAWEVSKNKELNIIEITLFDTIVDSDMKDATDEAMKLAKSYDYSRFLVVVQNAESYLSTLAIHEQSSVYQALAIDRRNKLGLVVPGEGKLFEDAQFYEDTCRNNGWNVQIFTSGDKALEWLIAVP